MPYRGTTTIYPIRDLCRLSTYLTEMKLLIRETELEPLRNNGRIRKPATLLLFMVHWLAHKCH